MAATKIKTVGDTLREARVNAELTQGALAESLGYSNMQYVSNWECGRAGFPIAKAPLFCKITGMKGSLMKQVLLAAAAEKINKLNLK